MAEKKKVALLIVNHLKTQLRNGSFSDDSLESMEVAVQCIESAYNLNPTDSDGVDIKLENIVKEYYQQKEPKTNHQPELTQAKKEEAENHKKFGNEFMKIYDYEKAIEAYTASIRINPFNPIYHCNRAAAFNATAQYTNAIADCQKAIELDSTYCKAYCRLGLAFSYKKDYAKAVSCYKKACELDPDNAGYQRNYQLAVSNMETGGANPPEEPPSHTLIQTAARIMTENPDVSIVLNDFLGNVTGAGPESLDRLMEVGQTIVTQLQTANPNLLDGLRMQFQSAREEEPQNGFHDDDDDDDEEELHS